MKAMDTKCKLDNVKGRDSLRDGYRQEHNMVMGLKETEHETVNRTVSSGLL
jgi:hypothetical protein